MFGSYLQEIAFDEITLLGQSLKGMAGLLQLITESPDAQPALDPRPDPTRNAEGRAWRADGAGWPSLRDVFNHQCGMSECTLVLLCPFRDHGFVLNVRQSPPCRRSSSQGDVS